MEVSPEQIRAARALLRLGQADLAARAQVSVITIRRLEGAVGHKRVTPIVFVVICRALEQAGVEFIPDGVRRRRAVHPDSRSLYEDLRAISLGSATRLQGHEILTDADLYDEHGLPA